MKILELQNEILRVAPDDLVTIGVTGGRDYDDWRIIDGVLRYLGYWRPFTTIIHGNASGLDKHAGLWGMRNRKTVRAMSARWKLLGNSAGPRRNQDMLDLLLEASPHSMLVAFPGGSGTAHMTAISHQAGLPVLDVDPLIDGVRV